jgi:hypothetical protein
MGHPRVLFTVEKMLYGWAQIRQISSPNFSALDGPIPLTHRSSSSVMGRCWAMARIVLLPRTWKAGTPFFLASSNRHVRSFFSIAAACAELPDVSRLRAEVAATFEEMLFEARSPSFFARAGAAWFGLSGRTKSSGSDGGSSSPSRVRLALR